MVVLYAASTSASNTVSSSSGCVRRGRYRRKHGSSTRSRCASVICLLCPVVAAAGVCVCVCVPLLMLATADVLLLAVLRPAGRRCPCFCRHRRCLARSQWMQRRAGKQKARFSSAVFQTVCFLFS